MRRVDWAEALGDPVAAAHREGKHGLGYVRRNQEHPAPGHRGWGRADRALHGQQPEAARQSSLHGDLLFLSL